MLDETHEYDLRFVLDKDEIPCFEITIQSEYLAELTERLRIYIPKMSEHANEYLGTECSEFNFPDSYPDLFGRIEVGYEGCGFMENGGRIVSFRFPLNPKYLFSISLTLHVLFIVLSAPFDGVHEKNRQQQVHISARAKQEMHGHSVGGWINSSVVKWIGDYAKEKRPAEVEPDDWNQVNLPSDVTNAMRLVWEAVHDGGIGQYSSDCRGFFRENGCFTLICFGNACDLSIYSGRIHDINDCAIDFGCHNLDTSAQQVTLLAGLAKILELAENS